MPLLPGGWKFFPACLRHRSVLSVTRSNWARQRLREIFITEYVEKEKEVPWLIYSEQPDCVFFSHAAHVVKAGMDCRTCHGEIGESTTTRTYEENRITGYSRDIWGKNIWGIKKNSWDRMKMDDCAGCHEKETGSKGACFQCHK